MKQFIAFLFFTAFMLAALAGYGTYSYMRPNGLSEPKTIIIPRGTPSVATARLLADEGVIAEPYSFLFVNYATGATKQFKAGEYAFEPGITPFAVAAKLVKGDVVIHKITLPEGWNVRQLRELLLAEPGLSGDVTLPLPEGSLLPETYHFSLGEPRDVLVKRMQDAMKEVLADSWANRAEGLPYQTPEEALIMASIVERETGLPDERPRVAAVFVNRLRLGMPLQTDPTVIYGIEQQLGKAMGRELTRKDLETPTPYNTYVIGGLPPSPIANPGVASIKAALNPAKTDELYFVATGNGGHYFAKTLAEHNKNVVAYRSLRNDK